MSTCLPIFYIEICLGAGCESVSHEKLNHVKYNLIWFLRFHRQKKPSIFFVCVGNAARERVVALKGVPEYAFIINDDPYPGTPSITQGLFFLIGPSGKGEIKFWPQNACYYFPLMARCILAVFLRLDGGGDWADDDSCKL